MLILFIRALRIVSYSVLKVTSDGGQEVGKITKQWAGYAKEMFTSADNFGVTCT